jgi:small subunit ribosomal protein S5
MTEEKNNEKEVNKDEASIASKEAPSEVVASTADTGNEKNGNKKIPPRGSRPPFKQNMQKRGKRMSRRGRRGAGDRVKSEFDQKVIDIRRVTRVVSGGRRFSFSVSLVAGNRKGTVGVGVGKSSDTASAIEKASRSAKKNMVKIKLNKNMSIPHEVEAKFSSARIIIKPSPGKGLVAGSSVRNVLDLAGVKDVNSKILSRSKNKLNNARAAIKALKEIKEVSRN